MFNDGYGIGKHKEGLDWFNIDSKERLNFLQEVLARKFSDNKLLNEKLDEYKKTDYGVDFEDFKLFEGRYD